MNLFANASFSYDCVAGVDEVGRGSLVGPVTAAAVILDGQQPISGLRDSKKLTPAARTRLSIVIRQQAICWSIGWASAYEIDQFNIHQATFIAMQRAVSKLAIQPEFIVVDGNQTPNFGSIPVQAIVRGDSSVEAISAASIVAKTARDQLMQQWHHLYPMYGFDSNKGYPTKKHRQAIYLYGVTILHRTSFSLHNKQ